MMENSESREFDWLEDAGDVVIPAQTAVAIYPGPSGIVIRREPEECESMAGLGDAVITFAVEHAPAIAAAILAAAGLDATALALEPARACSKPKGASGAERQRRYRDRQKKDSTPEPDIFDRDDRDDRDVTPVTPRDGKAA